jgi:hypothetical protein
MNIGSRIMSATGLIPNNLARTLLFAALLIEWRHDAQMPETPGPKK